MPSALPPPETADPRRRAGARVIGTFIDALDWDDCLQTIWRWTALRASRSVCCCNVHTVVTRRRNAELGAALSTADMTTADGMPVAWMLRRLGFAGQERISGPDLMWTLCAMAASEGVSIYLYGNTPDTLRALAARLTASFPLLRIAGQHSPPFRKPTREEDDATLERIDRSGARLVFVSLGCPKQEIWMAAHRGRLSAVMVGVGAAFDYHAGSLARAPLWMRRCGLEWLHRLASEPLRLGRRYAVTNSVFMLAASAQLLLHFSARLRRRFPGPSCTRPPGPNSPDD